MEPPPPHPNGNEMEVDPPEEFPEGPEDAAKYIADSNHLLALFPEDIWLLLMNMMTDPKDRESFRNFSAYTRRFFQDKLTTIFFPKVFKILQKNFKCHEPHVPEGSNEGGAIMPVPAAGPNPDPMSVVTSPNGKLTLWCQTMLKMRLVCKTWCSTIDTHLSSMPHNYTGYSTAIHPSNQNQVPNVTDKRTWNQLVFSEQSDPELPQKFLDHFRFTHSRAQDANNNIRSPFLGNSVYIRFSEQSTNPNFANSIRQLWQTYGSSINHCYLSFHYTTLEGYLTHYEFLVLALECLPNLLGLTIEHLTDNPEAQAMLNGPRQNPMEAAHFAQFNLPIDIDGVKFVQTKFTPKYLEWKIVNRFIDVEIFTRQPNSPQDNYYALVGLEDDDFRLCIDYRCAKGRELEEELNIWHWNYCELLLDFEGMGFVNWDELFMYMRSRWEGHVEKVWMKFPRPGDEEKRQTILVDSMYMRLGLKRVKNVRIQAGDKHSLDFLLGMKESLEELEVWREWEDGEWLEEQTVEFFGRVGNREGMLRSNIWELFPVLMRLEVKSLIGGGESYEVKRENREWQMGVEEGLNQNL